VRIWRGRHAAPLIAIWLLALIVVAILYRIEDIQPALSDLIRPVYVIVLALALLVTWKWFRARTGGAEHDRRRGDRRHTDRREDNSADL
jgi:cobalamin synthase